MSSTNVDVEQELLMCILHISLLLLCRSTGAFGVRLTFTGLTAPAWDVPARWA